MFRPCLKAVGALSRKFGLLQEPAVSLVSVRAWVTGKRLAPWTIRMAGCGKNKSLSERPEKNS